MTGNDTPRRGGPPWSLDLLADLHADLHAGVLDPELRERVAADPDASATLAALDATRQALSELPPLRMPEHVAARLDAAIATEAANRAATATLPAQPPASTDSTAPTDPAGLPAPAKVIDFTAERKRRRGGLIAGAGLLTAAAAAIAVVAVVNLTGGTTGGEPQAANPSDQATTPLALSSNDLGSAVNEALGATDYGPLAGRDKLDACLAANGVDPGDADPVGAREVTLDGRPGVLILLPAGANPPRWRLLVVGSDCGPNRPATLADTTTGR